MTQRLLLFASRPGEPSRALSPPIAMGGLARRVPLGSRHLLVAVVLFLAVAQARAEDPIPEPLSNPRRPGDVPPMMGLPPELAGLTMQQNLGAKVPDDLTFTDEDGKAVRLGDYFSNGKPIILVLAYYRCPGTCNEVLNRLVEELRPVKYALGKDFTILTVSFDAREKPELAALKKARYVEAYNRPGAAEGWHFLTGEEPAIQRLADVVGFRFRYDAERDRFAHPTGLMLLTPDGKVARYLMGLAYTSRILQLSLVEASDNKIHSFEDQVMLLCLQYDGATGRYTVSVLALVRAAGVLTVLILAVTIFRAWRRGRAASQALTTVGRLS